MHSFDLTIDRMTKVEGSASLEIRVKDNKVEHVHFKITEFKRFFTEAMKGKPLIALPQLLARICGTCSNAHLICSIEACENSLGITPSERTMLLRLLTTYGLMIRDHALHLYLFVLPDIYGKDYFPDKSGVEDAVKKLEAIRPAVLRLIEIYKNAPFRFDRKTNFAALVPDKYWFLDGCINTGKGECLPEKHFGEYLERTVLPYSQASAYKHEGESYMVGAMARLNLAKDRLHPRSKNSLGETLDIFPSTNIFHNNLAQAIEILHCVDHSIEILTKHNFEPEPIIKAADRETTGIGVIEAPRGTLYHKVSVGADGLIKEGEVVVPTGQNQINIEEDVWRMVEESIAETPKDKIVFEIEKLIRAYDPCMSCASHFLKVNWREE